MKYDIIRLGSMALLGAVVSSAGALAQEDEDFFIRDKYEAVTDRSQPEFDPISIQTGGFDVTPQVRFITGFTSNLFATETDETDDIFVGIVPSIEFDSTWSRHAFGFDGRIDHLEYSDTSSESRTNLSLGTDGRLDVSNTLFLFGAAQFEDLNEPRSNIASLQDAAEPAEFSRVGGEAGAQYQSGRLRLRGAVGLVTFDYDDVELNSGLFQDQDFRDRDETTVRLRGAYAVQRDWAVFAEVDRRESDYDAPNIFNPLNRDFSTTSLRVGTNFELRSLLRGDVGVGAFTSEYDEPTVEDIDGVSVDGNLQWFATQLTTVSLGASRGVIDPGLIQTNAAVRTNLGVRADHEFRRNVILTGEARFTNFDFENTNRNDDRWNLSTSAIWKLNPNIWLDGSLQMIDQSSNVQEFTESRVLVGFRVFP